MTSTDPRLGQIRLAWWRDRLEELDTEGPPVGEPLLNAVNRHLMPVTNGAMLSMMTDAWMPLLSPFPWGQEVADGLRERGRLLFGTGARILDDWREDADAAGALWSLVDAARHCSDPISRGFLLTEALKVELPRSVPRELRPLTILAALAASDSLGGGQPARVAAALVHRVTGRFPR